MLYSDYKNYTIKQISPHLLWEYNLNDFDYQAMRKVVVQRVIERGWPNDFYAIFNLYGKRGVIDTIKQIPYLNKIDINFVHKVFHIPLKQLKCYTKMPLEAQHWNS